MNLCSMLQPVVTPVECSDEGREFIGQEPDPFLNKIFGNTKIG